MCKMFVNIFEQGIFNNWQNRFAIILLNQMEIVGGSRMKVMVRKAATKTVMIAWTNVKRSRCLRRPSIYYGEGSGVIAAKTLSMSSMVQYS